MMKPSACLLLCLAQGWLTVLLPMSVRAQDVGVTTSTDNKADIRTDQQNDAETAIRARVEEFVKAYNAHDAEAVAGLFLPQAQIVDEADNTIQGRDNIQRVFAEVFAEQPDTGISIHVESIRFIGTHLAVENGTTTTIPPAGQTPESGRYSVLHILQGGTWMMGVVRDVPAEPSHRDQLQALSWLVGNWVDESRDGKVRTSCRWADNDSFLLQEITILRTGKEMLRVNQRIGWDPLKKQFKAWVFDSEGGYGESQWTPTESGWLIRATYVNTDGTTATATNRITQTGQDRYVFESTDRVSGDELLPAVRVIVVRQPPQPLEPDTVAAPEK